MFDNFKDLEALGFSIGITTSDFDSTDDWLKVKDVIIGTNEKIDSLIRHSTPWLKDVGIIIADEVHLLGDRYRGHVLEIILTRLKEFLPDAQIIALSATINNAKDIARWLNAELVESNWRPVVLNEGIILDDKIQFSDGHVVRLNYKDSNPMISAALDGITNNGQVLVFASTRRKAVIAAKKLASKIKKDKSISRLIPDNSDLVEELENEGELTDTVELLMELVQYGVAFHHAGLRHGVRKIIEHGFRNNKIKILTATTTLAAGVNLPARRVIIQDLSRYESGLGMIPIPVMEYKQQAGRAGRPKYDKFGEALIIARSPLHAIELQQRYIEGTVEPVYSTLSNEKYLRVHLLSKIALDEQVTLEDLNAFLKSTYLGFLQGSKSYVSDIYPLLAFMVEEALILKVENDLYEITPFGKKVSHLYIDPITGVMFRNALEEIDEKSRYNNVLNLLFLIAQVPDFRPISCRAKEQTRYWQLFLENRKRLLEIQNPFDFEENNVMNALKSAWVLFDWINEKSEQEITSTYGIESGDLHNLTSTSYWLIYSLGALAKLLEFDDLHSKIEELSLRIKYGIRQQLLELVRLEQIGRKRARILYNNGFKTLEDLKQADPSKLAALQGFGPELINSIRRQLGLPIIKIKSKKLTKNKQQTLV